MHPETEIKAIPKLVLVGPTNVGKSTLFNRLTRTRKAIVCDRPGVTVDRNELLVKDSPIGSLWVIDTGGVGMEARKHPLGAEIERAAEAAIRDASLILFVVDGTREMAMEELEIASWLRKQKNVRNETIWLVANKSDAKKFEASSYAALGFYPMVDASAEHDLGIQELWEKIEAFLGKGEEVPLDAPVEVKDPGILVLGRPNVGKSTLMNALLGEERHVVSDTPGTTRDPIESPISHHGKSWRLHDTAGLRRPGRLERDVEWVAKEKLKEVARDANLAIMVVDAYEGVSDQDSAIAGMALDFGLSLIVVMNKWDKMSGQDAEDRFANLERTQDLKMDFMSWCPVLRISALSGKGIPQLLNKIEEVLEARNRRVQTARLNDVFEEKFKYHSHPLGPRGKTVKFYYLSQVDSNPPEFVFFANISGQDVHFSYKRFVTNTLRDVFGFQGTPIKLHFKAAR